jgi:hypothetical protein
MAQRVAGSREHAGDQHIVDRRGLCLGAAPPAVRPLQRQLDRLGFAGVGHAGGVVEGGDAGDSAAPASLHQAVKIATSARNARSVLPAIATIGVASPTTSRQLVRQSPAKEVGRPCSIRHGFLVPAYRFFA